jgi:hypothetical protein
MNQMSQEAYVDAVSRQATFISPACRRFVEILKRPNQSETSSKALEPEVDVS